MSAPASTIASMRNTALVEQVLALEPGERRELVDIASDSLTPVSEETLDLVEAAVERWEADPSCGTPWEEARARLFPKHP